MPTSDTVAILGLTAMCSVGSLGAAVAGYLTTRDALRHSAEVVGLRRDVAALVIRVNDCHADRDEMRTELAELRRWREARESRPPPVGGLE